MPGLDALLCCSDFPLELPEMSQPLLPSAIDCFGLRPSAGGTLSRGCPQPKGSALYLVTLPQEQISTESLIKIQRYAPPPHLNLG